MSSIKKQLKKIQVATLTKQEQTKIWKQVCLGMAQKQKSSIFYNGLQLHISSLVKKLVAATLIFGMTTGTAFAANSARPGDFLFPLDRAMEKAQLSIASQEKKDILKVKFALERVGETKEIVNEIKTKTEIKRTEKNEPAIITPSYNKLIEKPVEVSAPEEIIAEENPPKEMETEIEIVPISSNASTTQNSLIEQQGIATTSLDNSQQNLEDALVEDIKNIETEQIITKINNILEENGTTTIAEYAETQIEIKQEYVEISDTDKKRIELALGTTLDFLGDIKGELAEQGNSEAVSSVNNLLEELNSEIKNLPKNVSFEVKLSPTKKSVKFEITSKNDKSNVQIGVPAGDNDAPKKEDIKKENNTLAKPPMPTDPLLEIQNDILKIKTGGDVLIQKERKGAFLKLNIPVPPRPTNEGEDYQIETGQTLEDVDATIINNGSTTVEEVGDIKKNKDEEIYDANKKATTTESINTKINKIDDSTTTIKMILENTKNTFDFSITDNNSNLHKIIEDYTKAKKTN